jgi:hypothetical protein
MNAWDDSLAQLKNRDETVDFSGSILVDSSCLEYQAFYTMNHPTIMLLQDYIYSVLSVLGVGYSRTLCKSCDDPLSFWQYPIYDFWASHNRLSYRTAQHIGIHRKFFFLNEFFVNSYQAYRCAGSDCLVVSSPSELA